jgi:hypothetical protein
VRFAAGGWWNSSRWFNCHSHQPPDCLAHHVSLRYHRGIAHPGRKAPGLHPKEGPGSGVEEVNKWMASIVIPILDAKDRAEVLARAQAFWFDLQANPSYSSEMDRYFPQPDQSKVFVATVSSVDR